MMLSPEPFIEKYFLGPDSFLAPFSFKYEIHFGRRGTIAQASLP